MKPFNYDEWKKNPRLKVITKSGIPVKFKDFYKGERYPLFVVLNNSETHCYTKNGKYIQNKSNEYDLYFADEQPDNKESELMWRKCKSGYKFPSDAIVIPDDERTTDRDPRLVRCAVWDSKYILIDDLKKLPVDNG